MELEQELIDSLKSKHGERLTAVSNEEATFIVRPPTEVEFMAFQSMATKEGKRPQALRDLATVCIVWPDRNQAKEWFARYPGLRLECADVAAEMAFGEQETTRKKL